MTKKRILEALESDDRMTKRWRATFSAGRMAYDSADFRQAETLLARAREMARDLPEHTYAENATEIGTAAVMLATNRAPIAKSRLEKTISHLSCHVDKKHQELLAVAIRFYAQALLDIGDARTAEKELQKSVDMLQKLGTDASVQLAYSLCDLCGLYLSQQRYSEAEQHITKSMTILGTILGPDAPDYTRADMIYYACGAMAPETRLDVVSDGIQRMQYMYGTKHPNVARALKRYFEALQARGDKAAIKDAEERFGLTAKVDR